MNSTSLVRSRIKQAWEEGKRVREIMLFLHGHGVSISKAVLGIGGSRRAVEMCVGG
jgi:hypothetical protein